MYKLILLDADRTIWDFDRSEVYSVKKAFEERGISEDLDQMIANYRLINMELWELYEKGDFDKKAIPTERFLRLFNKYHLDLDPESFGESYLKHLSQCGFVLPHAKEVCKYLYSKYKVVILTNGIQFVQENRMKHSPINQYFHELVISDVAGVPKPNTKIYDYTLEKVGYYEKDEILMIGDSLTSDIQGGINYNIDTCWLNPEGKDSGHLEPTYVISNLEEIYNIL